MSLRSAAAQYANIFSLSSGITNAWIRGNIVSCTRAVRDLEENTNRIMYEVYPKDSSKSTDLIQDIDLLSTVEIGRCAVMDISPSGKKIISISNKDDNTIISIQNKEGISFKIDASSKHGKVIGDSWLGGYSWSHDEAYFVYVAQQKEVEVKSSFDKDADSFRNKFDYKEDWGEKYDGVSKLCLCLVNVSSGSVIVVPGIDADLLTVGQPVFSPNAYSLVYTAWSTLPRRLGMIYCYQRSAHLYSVDVTALLLPKEGRLLALEHVNITPDVYVSRSPRFSPDGQSLVFIGSVDSVSSHNSCFQLLRLATPFTSPIEIIVDKVHKPTSYPHDFPGLFCDQLSRSCFLSNDELVVNTQWGSTESVIAISLSTRTITRIDHLVSILDEPPLVEDTSEPAYKQPSCSVLDVAGGCMVFIASSPVSPQCLGIYDVVTKKVLRSKTPIMSVSSKTLVSGDPRELLKGLRWRMFAFKDETGIPFDSILITPVATESLKQSLPLVVVVHGGPHSVSPTSFLASYTFLSSHLNAAVLHVNYRGSTGFGLASVDSLLGNIGTNDVSDVMTCITHAEKLTNNQGIPIIDSTRMSIVGGSHGGFLGSHLIGQFPDLFKAAALRNPVTNIPAMFSITDIPDWCHVETRGNDAFDFTSFNVPSQESISIAYRKSPIFYIGRVKTPTLLCIGAKDRRVPCSQGIEYYHALQSRGVPSKMLYFPEDVHAIDKPASEAEQWVQVADFISKYTESE